MNQVSAETSNKEICAVRKSFEEKFSIRPYSWDMSRSNFVPDEYRVTYVECAWLAWEEAFSLPHARLEEARPIGRGFSEKDDPEPIEEKVLGALADIQRLLYGTRLYANQSKPTLLFQGLDEFITEHEIAYKRPGEKHRHVIDAEALREWAKTKAPW